MPEYIKSTSYWRLPAPGSDGWFENRCCRRHTQCRSPRAACASIFVPYTLMLSNTQYLILRTSRDPLSMTRSIRAAVQTVDPDQPVNAIRTAESALADAGWARERFVTLLLLGFAAFALMLAAVGLYSVVSYSVSCRSKEFGIRMALGAGRRRIVNAAVQPGGLSHRRGPLRWSRIERGAEQGCSPVVDRRSERSGRARRRQPGAVVVTMMSAAIPANRAASIPPVDALRID